MHRIIVFLGIVILISCKVEKRSEPTAQSIIDSSIAVSGGALYGSTIRSFAFRDKNYVSENGNGKKTLKRILKNDTVTILDVRTNQKFERYVNDSLVQLHDTTANKYANSVNSVHYFASLPFGLNDPAVHKELLGNATVKGKEYHKIKVTFDQNGGGDDFDDIYVYWFNKKTWKPDYLAYEFHVDGGGMRFREAFNERYVNGIRFVDYHNYKTADLATSILKIDSLFEKGSLELLSEIELKDIQVNQGSYN
ncbi:MAG: DUF6503 family protein [Aurantibacter sp.]